MNNVDRFDFGNKLSFTNEDDLYSCNTFYLPINNSIYCYYILYREENVDVEVVESE